MLVLFIGFLISSSFAKIYLFNNSLTPMKCYVVIAFIPFCVKGILLRLWLRLKEVIYWTSWCPRGNQWFWDNQHHYMEFERCTSIKVTLDLGYSSENESCPFHGKSSQTFSFQSCRNMVEINKSVCIMYHRNGK